MVPSEERLLGPAFGLGVRDQPLPDSLGDLGRRCLWHVGRVLPSRRTQYRRPAGCRMSSMRCVGPPRFFRLMRMSAGSLGTNLTPQMS